MIDQDRAKRLRQARKKWAERIGEPTMKAAEAARKLGIPPATYSGHENGSRGIKNDVGKRYADKFGVSFDWLMNGRGTPSPSGLQKLFDKIPTERQSEAIAFLEFLASRE